ncbi:MAG: PAS domain-containing protein, partial [Spirochaetaceae bacterium]
MLDQAPVGIYESWSSGTFRSMNHEMARILGFSNVDDALVHYHSIGTQLYVDPERRAHLIELLETEGRVRSFQIEAYRADGARMSLTTNAAVIERDPAQGLLIGGFVVDQTRQRRAERRLAQSREEYRSVVQLAREIIVRFDLEGKWSFLNNEACRFFGVSREELLGRRYLDYVHPDDRARTLQAVAELRARKRSVEGFENRQLTPEGWQLVEWNTAPILGESGECAGVQAIGRNVTEQRLME